ncbi:hypothetical protein SAMN05421821_11480 [Mucilaginibacter lappiensis]|uniref:Uncharacterized protein n=1 Tax=Mucilaginibacter lappiensis TaxID=354630 RepID=A0ABR6PPU5_9SPHI|nr:hypothetical protein [Mucilaginibacter lappiensis]SIR87745.1 hypothetical protein SAMN05421821_11480 [Mucilaginibacter lappiensis]
MSKYLNKERIGIILLLIVIITNLIVAIRFYNLDSMRLNDFFLGQGQNNELFNPNIRY